jgi:hypothetical protein
MISIYCGRYVRPFYDKEHSFTPRVFSTLPNLEGIQFGYNSQNRCDSNLWRRKWIMGISRQHFELATHINIYGLSVCKLVGQIPPASAQTPQPGTLFAFVNRGNKERTIGGTLFFRRSAPLTRPVPARNAKRTAEWPLSSDCPDIVWWPSTVQRLIRVIWGDLEVRAVKAKSPNMR